VDMSDAVNVLVYVDGSADASTPGGNNEAGERAAAAAPVQELYGQPLMPTHGAVWHIFSQADTRLLQLMLPAIVRERGLSERCQQQLDSTSPLLDGSIYLDDQLLAELAEQAGILPYVVLQRLGDAILVPAGCAHQVHNVRSCIKVAADFVAAEHVDHVVRLTEELRQLPAWHHRRADVLSVRSILLYAACACLSGIDENKRREEARREKQRRAAAKMAVTADATSEPPSPRALVPPPTSSSSASATATITTDHAAPPQESLVGVPPS
jgi:lysine-specific demethylase 3